MTGREDQRSTEVSWRRVRAIFNHPAPPKQVWEKQFDYFDEELARMAYTPYDEIAFCDLWYYFHDLAYVDLQPDLFRYLFPVCLMAWHTSLLENRPCAQGDAEFHYALVQGNIFEKMLTAQQRAEVFAFFRDSFLQRLDAERGFVHDGMQTPAYGWLARLGSLAMVMPAIDTIWEPWWEVGTPGRAVSLLQFCSGLIYREGENPLFDAWSPDRGGGGPHLWGNDSYLHDQGWLPGNIEYVTGRLTYREVLAGISRAVNALTDLPEHATATEVLHQAEQQQARVELRLRALPRLLLDPEGDVLRDWSQ